MREIGRSGKSGGSPPRRGEVKCFSAPSRGRYQGSSVEGQLEGVLNAESAIESASDMDELKGVAATLLNLYYQQLSATIEIVEGNLG